MKRFLTFLALGFLSFSCFAQDQKTITGTLRDESTGNPIPSATVTIKGSKAATGTDANGTFRLLTNAANPTLIFTSVGYDP